ncbi:hypothetical protein [Tumebacillus permanentifrigoris]|uniref:Uncharacterized protein n=1 Tax=Tumebacillus permanentifrigoris TaxID=378543 RepID=A0A316DCM8_9BACL|nr:hypothetical protein [Tumebacillus permanentifrigoris]PWK15488.1 hypothetical protein C7459_10324 [Tumebacillus permanentifrigoris]
MTDSFQSLSAVKAVLIMHLLRQQVEADLNLLASAPLLLSQCLVERLQGIHGLLLNRVADHKRLLRRYGVRIVEQQKNSLDFQIAYMERGYRVQHCFLLATLQAEAQVLFKTLLEGGTT